MKKIQFLLLGLAVLCLSCKSDDEYQQISSLDVDLESILIETSNGIGKSFYILPNSLDLNSIPQDPNNSLTREKVALGQLLFHETGLAKKAKYSEGMNTYSCASCHHAAAGFQAGKRQGIGDGGLGFGIVGELRRMNPNYALDSLDIQPIKSPTALNVAYQKLMLWNGQFGATDLNIGTENQWTENTPKETNRLGFEGVETQAIAGLSVHRMDVNKELITFLGYKEMFDSAFPNVKTSERYTLTNAGLAIAAYERTILANKAPFQNWLAGDNNAITENEKKGAILFFGKGKCASCHNGPSLGSMRFSAIGMEDLKGANILTTEIDLATKKGRGGFTKNPDDDYKFKVPQLYSIKYNGFYGHGSSFNSIRQVISYKNKAIKENSDVPNSSLDKDFQPLNLSEQEIELLALFVENSLNDSDLSRYTPEKIMSGNCFPNNDHETREQVGWQGN